MTNVETSAKQSGPPIETHDARPDKFRGAPAVVGAAVLVILAFGGIMVWRADAKTNKVALASSAKPVSVTAVKASSYRASRTYVGTLEPWGEAKIGPQFVSAYVDTVLVRPGAVVKRGEIIATLDCRNASAASQAVAMQARAIDAQQKAVSHEATRVQGLLDGGFVSPNEAEQKTAQSAAQEAQLLATKAKLMSTALEVSDCILRAPFDGEIATRTADPGAFARPGSAIVSIVDRSVIRLTADAPEIDFDVVSPTTKVKVRVLALGKDLLGSITRRSPSADPGTRTVHFEVDLPDPQRQIPVGTTGEVHIDVGEPVPATEIPLFATSVRGSKASLFVIDGDVAHSRTVAVKGESGGSLFVDTELKAGSLVVTEGRALLEDGDRVTTQTEAPPAATTWAAPAAAPAKERRP